MRLCEYFVQFIALIGKGSTCEASIYFSWRDTDKIRSAKHDRREADGFWRWILVRGKRLRSRVLGVADLALGFPGADWVWMYAFGFSAPNLPLALGVAHLFW